MFLVTKMDIKERFWSKVDISGLIPPVMDSSCWLWGGTTTGNGYGRFNDKGQKILAHRWAYESVVGPIPLGLTLDHLCRTRNCVNPEHLEPVTLRTNILHGGGLTAQNSRKIKCPSGHPYDRDNIYLSQNGRNRQCRICRHLRNIKCKNGS